MLLLISVTRYAHKQLDLPQLVVNLFSNNSVQVFYATSGLDWASASPCISINVQQYASIEVMWGTINKKLLLPDFDQNPDNWQSEVQPFTFS
jgi:hypothetical protein